MQRAILARYLSIEAVGGRDGASFVNSMRNVVERCRTRTLANDDGSGVEGNGPRDPTTSETNIL